MRTVIINGTVVNADGQYRQDVLIENDLISQIAPDIVPETNDRVIDAQGCYVFPGGIDVHTHFNIDVGLARSCDDFYTGTRAAACGGTTTIIDHMGFGPAGCSLHHQLENYHRYAKGRAVIDYSFHGVIQHINDDILKEIPLMVADGISSFKLYLTYQYKLDDPDILRALQQLNRSGALTTVHPENDAVIAQRKAEFVKKGQTSPVFHALSRPAECETEAIGRMINLARICGNAPLYIVHLSNGSGLDYLKMAKARHQPVWIETCPQYLFLDERCYERDDGLKFILSPPLRNRREADALWLGIDDGDIDVVATDHCTFPYQQRLALSGGDFTRCPNGLPGVENRMLLLFSAGVMQGRISPEHFVSLTSAMPAKLFGIWPEKGVIRPGADGDITIIDPAQETTIRHADLHDNADYSPYEGMTVQGAVRCTLSRGDIVYRDGEFTAEPGRGRFLKRRPFKTPHRCY